MISIRLFLKKKKITWLKMTIKLSFGFWCVKGVLISIKFNDFILVFCFLFYSQMSDQSINGKLSQQTVEFSWDRIKHCTRWKESLDPPLPLSPPLKFCFNEFLSIIDLFYRLFALNLKLFRTWVLIELLTFLSILLIDCYFILHPCCMQLN